MTNSTNQNKLRIRFRVHKIEIVCTTVLLPADQTDPSEEELATAINQLKEHVHDQMWERVAPDEFIEVEDDSFTPEELRDTDGGLLKTFKEEKDT